MALTEIYLKLAVGFPNDSKVRALARFGAPDAGLARDLYVQMCLYCKEHLTDGFVPSEQVGLLVYPLDAEHGNQLAKQLASVGLTKEVSNGEATGWQVVAYVRRNGTREDVERLSQVRAASGRNGGIARGKRARQRAAQAKPKQVAKHPGEQTGSNAVSVSVVPNGPTDTDPQTPTVSAAAASSQPLSDTQRSKRLTDAYDAATTMCNWPAVNGVVLKAVRSGRFTDEEIHAALLRMARDNRSVTVDALRTELQGLPVNNRGSSAPGPERARGWMAAGREFQADAERAGKEISQ